MVTNTSNFFLGVKRLHVTNLPFRINETDLSEMFGVSEMCTQVQSCRQPVGNTVSNNYLIDDLLNYCCFHAVLV